MLITLQRYSLKHVLCNAQYNEWHNTVFNGEKAGISGQKLFVAVWNGKWEVKK